MNSFSHKLAQWRNLPPWERGALLRLAMRLPLSWLRLRLFRLPAPQGEVGTAGRDARATRLPPGLSPQQFAQRCAQLCEIAARHGLYRANCLHQALALRGLLRSAGLGARLRIGVAPDSKPLQAHAWVELDGTPLGKPVGGYRAFPGLDLPEGVRRGFGN